MSEKQIRVGTTVTVEATRGPDAGAPVTGKVYLDEDGCPRVAGINVHRDADGYFPSWVIVHKIGK